MQLDPTATLMASESAVPVGADAANQEAEPVSDLFAALLSALAPGSAVAPQPEAEPTAGSTDPEAPGSGLAPESPAMNVLMKFIGGHQGTGTSPVVVADDGNPAGHVEVPRAAHGLPLSPVGVAIGAALQPPTPAKAANRPTVGSPLPEAQPLLTEPALAEAEASPTTPLRASGRTAAAGPTLSTAAENPETTANDGRPVRVAEQPSTAATRKPMPAAESIPVPDVENAPETEAKTSPTAQGEGAPESAPSQTTVAAAPQVGPEGRPVTWQPDLGTTPAPSVVAPVHPSSNPITSGHATAPEAPAPPPADPQQIQSQVLRQVLARFEAADGRPQQITLQLNPEHLGKVEVRLVVNGGQLQVEFQAETAEAGVALREGQQELVRNLTAQVGRWQHVEVKVAEREGPVAKNDDQQEERSEQGSRRERDHQQRRRQRGDR